MESIFEIGYLVFLKKTVSLDVIFEEAMILFIKEESFEFSTL